MKVLMGALLIISLAGCSKDSSSNDKQAPAVTINTPLANQRFNAGQTVSIAGTITDNNKLAELHVHISNTDNGALLVDIHRYPSGSTYSLSETFQVQPGINYRIQVIAKDNSANEGRASVDISTN
ncbi:MAG: DUF4625 domain-containing protein [Chitinophagaceae bacterium]|nr:DUF4625 domain-containing protein [Chitinophagaceae bacterium]